ncbi:MAG: PAC2 family protein [Chloroflexi bacterium]|nr:PAC2 family protein [Chloroflexota bacterium]
MQEIIKLYTRPQLNSPSLLASWPGIGNVSMIVASYLRSKLGFEELGELDAPYFFDPIGVTVKDNVVEAPQFPQSKFYYWKNPAGANDLILFVGDDQPGFKVYELANNVIDMAQMFGVKRVYTCAAALSRIHHTEQPEAWGVTTTPQLASELATYNLVRKENLHIAGLNGLLLGVAKERGIEGVCLLGEVPAYATRIENPKAALVVLKAFGAMVKVDIDLTDLTQVAKEAESRMRQLTAEAMSEYIDHFTRPIWEQEEEEEDDEEEEG